MYNMLPRLDGLTPEPRSHRTPAPELRSTTAVPRTRGGIAANACSSAPLRRGIVHDVQGCLRRARSRKGTEPTVQNGELSSSCRTAPCREKPTPWEAHAARGREAPAAPAACGGWGGGGGGGEKGSEKAHGWSSAGWAASAVDGTAVAIAPEAQAHWMIPGLSGRLRGLPPPRRTRGRPGPHGGSG